MRTNLSRWLCLSTLISLLLRLVFHEEQKYPIDFRTLFLTLNWLWFDSFIILEKRENLIITELQPNMVEISFLYDKTEHMTEPSLTMKFRRFFSIFSSPIATIFIRFYSLLSI